MKKIIKNISNMKCSAYEMNKREFISTITSWICLIVAIAMLFYGRLWIAVTMFPGIYFYFQFASDFLKKKRERQLKKEFKDFIMTLSDSMKVGFSVENSMKECARELKMIYGEESMMGNEITDMLREISLRQPTERVLEEFAKRTNIPEITLFSAVFTISKKTGGRVNQLMVMVADSINDSFLVDEEIEVAISEKKLEQIIMSFVPAGIILYLWLTSPELVEVLHNSMMGNVVMTGCLIAYIGANYLAYRIISRGDLYG